MRILKKQKEEEDKIKKQLEEQINKDNEKNNENETKK